MAPPRSHVVRLTIRSSRARFAAAEMALRLGHRRGRKAVRLNSGVRPTHDASRMLKIDLNDPSQFTRENVARLIGSVLDTQHWQLRVTKDGIAYLSDIVGSENIVGLAFRFETWCAHNNYVGFQAAHDSNWVDHVFQDLKDNWPNPSSTHIGT